MEGSTTRHSLTYSLENSHKPFAFNRSVAAIVGSEEARFRTGLRPPLKLYVPISGIQLSRRWPRTRAIAQGRNQRNQVEQANFAVQLRGRQLLPAATPPSPISVRPNTPHDPAIEFVEERSDVGALVVLAPPTQCRIQLLDQLRGHFSSQRGYQPRLWIRRSSSEHRRDLNPPEQRAAQRTSYFVVV
jgi:hypothetical protein